MWFRKDKPEVLSKKFAGPLPSSLLEVLGLEIMTGGAFEIFIGADRFQVKNMALLGTNRFDPNIVVRSETSIYEHGQWVPFYDRIDVNMTAGGVIFTIDDLQDNLLCFCMIGNPIPGHIPTRYVIYPKWSAPKHTTDVQVTGWHANGSAIF